MNKKIRIFATLLLCSHLAALPSVVAAQQKIAPQASPASPSAAAQVIAPTGPAPSVQANEAIEAAVNKSGSSPHDMSPWGMFLAADVVVKLVMVGLVFASLVTWTVFIGKYVELTRARRRLGKSLSDISQSKSLNDAKAAHIVDRDLLGSLINSAIAEVRMSAGLASDSGIKERAASRFADVTKREMSRVRFGMGLLATIGATAPFVGLFGTVWGIMNSFIGISKAQTTNLAVVAPGIAEALLATAIGLVAAIPAVIIYNHFARMTKGYIEQVSRATGAVGRLLSRDLDRAHALPLSRAAE